MPFTTAATRKIERIAVICAVVFVAFTVVGLVSSFWPLFVWKERVVSVSPFHCPSTNSSVSAAAVDAQQLLDPDEAAAAAGEEQTRVVEVNAKQFAYVEVVMSGHDYEHWSWNEDIDVVLVNASANGTVLVRCNHSEPVCHIDLDGAVPRTLLFVEIRFRCGTAVEPVDAPLVVFPWSRVATSVYWYFYVPVIALTVLSCVVCVVTVIAAKRAQLVDRMRARRQEDEQRSLVQSMITND